LRRRKGFSGYQLLARATLSRLPSGSHNITVYVTDISGNVGVSETIYFSVEVPEPFPVLPVVAVSGLTITAVAACLLYYHKKRLS